MLSQIDFAKTFAAIAGAEASFPDSRDASAVLLGESDQGRSEVIEHAGQLAIRAGDWKFIPPGQGAKRSKYTNTELGNEPTGQLYDLSKDPGEKTNLASDHPEKVTELKAKLEAIR
ncbi:MAG: hypothetical protein EOP83_32545 [Verrucomicrobiaceae bacterium]|nr:MAG: hypothetical protein EOP83_32545 [Verrucomicrobiaceae bacterium]